jgi:uracil phosphoribosyltransferase
MVHNLGLQNSVFNQFISEIRCTEKQSDRLRFRRNMERLGEIFAYEISKHLEYSEREITSPLGVANMKVLSEVPVLATILRAGLPLHQGVLNYFDFADNAFISAYRRHHKNGKFDIALEYVSCPQIDNRTLIIVDPMLATGASMEITYKALLNYGKPKHTHIIAAIASMEGVDFIKRKLNPKEVSLWVGAIDDELTAQSYIVPGLGDAGDLAYGPKIHLD